MSEISIKHAGTDVTTKGSRIVIKLMVENGQWIVADELKETNINWSSLSFGGKGNSIPSYRKVLKPAVIAKAFRLELFGNGWFGASDIRILSKPTGLAESTGVARQTAKPKTNSTAGSTKITKESTDTQSKVDSDWARRSLTDVSFMCPSSWVVYNDGKDGAYLKGTEDNPESGFGVMTIQAAELYKAELSTKDKKRTTISGRSGDLITGSTDKGNLAVQVFVLDQPTKQGIKALVGLCKSELSGTDKPVIARVFKTVSIEGGSEGLSPVKVLKPAPVKKLAASKPNASGSTMVTATLKNDSNENVHIFITGDTFGPNNRLTPGQSREISVALPADGRVTFFAGRGGNVLAKKVWGGEPGNDRRMPKVIFTSTNDLIITTMLK